MISSANNSSEIGNLYPNISSNKQDFFQTDSQLESSKNRSIKSTRFSKAGNPFMIPSKILSLTKSYDNCHVYSSESGFISRKMRLTDGKTLVVYRGHNGPVTETVVGYNNDLVEEFVVTSSWDKTLIKWNPDGKMSIIFKGHTDFVKCCLLFDNFVISASSDKTIKKWTLDGTEIASLKGHSRGVEKIVVDYNFLFSCSSDTLIRKWDLNTNTCLMEFKGHLTSVLNLCILDGAIWSSSADNTAKRWDVDTGVCDITLKCDDFVSCVAVGGDYVFTGGRDEEVRVWDSRTEKCVHVFHGHFDQVTSLVLPGNGTIVSGSLDGSLRTWYLCDIGKVQLVEEVQDEEAKDTILDEDEERELNELMNS